MQISDPHVASWSSYDVNHDNENSGLLTEPLIAATHHLDAGFLRPNSHVRKEQINLHSGLMMTKSGQDDDGHHKLNFLLPHIGLGCRRRRRVAAALLVDPSTKWIMAVDVSCVRPAAYRLLSSVTLVTVGTIFPTYAKSCLF